MTPFTEKTLCEQFVRLVDAYLENVIGSPTDITPRRRELEDWQMLDQSSLAYRIDHLATCLAGIESSAPSVERRLLPAWTEECEHRVYACTPTGIVCVHCGEDLIESPAPNTPAKPTPNEPEACSAAGETMAQCTGTMDGGHVWGETRPDGSAVCLVCGEATLPHQAKCSLCGVFMAGFIEETPAVCNDCMGQQAAAGLA